MRYYRYGKDMMQQEIEASEKEERKITGQFGSLVIDEDTVYEIDEECLRCHKKKKS